MRARADAETKEDLMAVTTERHGWHTAEVVTGGMSAEVTGGIAAVVLVILGLANVAPPLMLGIATVIIGAALILEAAVIAAEYAQPMMAGGAGAQGQLGSGLSVQFLGGLAGVILGILALVGISPLVLASAATVVFGAALVLGSSAIGRLNDLKMPFAGGEAADSAAQQLSREAISAAAGAQVFAGLGAIVLGILVVAVTVLLSGSAVGGKFLNLLTTGSR
jgi:hypothetical protein